MPINFTEISKALAAALALFTLGGQFAVYGLEIYNYIKAQSGMTDDEIRAHRDLTLDENERKLLANLAAGGATP